MWLLQRAGNEDGRLSALRLPLLAWPIAFALGFGALKQYLRSGHQIGLVVSLAALAAGVLTIVFPRRALGYWLGAASGIAFLGVTFPTTANHGYVAVFALGVALWGRFSPPQDAAFILNVARWLAITILVASGAQKLAYGTYDGGEFFAARVAQGDTRFVQLFSQIIPAGELAVSVREAAKGGPVQLTGAAALALSRSVPIIEILIGVMLLLRSARWAGAVLAIVFVCGIQVVVGEVTFAIMMLALLSLFAPVRNAVLMARLAGAVLVIVVIMATLHSPFLVN